MDSEKLINPITGVRDIDSRIKEKEAKELGYLEPEFYFRHLDDENEFCKIFTVRGKRVMVEISRPTFQYNKPVSINQERVLADVVETCSLDEPCESCGS